jgi:small subunit ribosomal protein S6
MYIIRPDLGEDALDQVISQYQTLLKDNGATDLDIQHRGKRRLAYEINRFREGVYIQMNYKGNSSTLIATLERSMRLNESVIRYLTICQDEAEEEATEPA